MARILSVALKGVLFTFTFTVTFTFTFTFTFIRSFLKIAVFWDVTQFSLVVKNTDVWEMFYLLLLILQYTAFHGSFIPRHILMSVPFWGFFLSNFMYYIFCFRMFYISTLQSNLSSLFSSTLYHPLSHISSYYLMIHTDYGLGGPGSHPGGDEIFRPSRPVLGPTQPPVKWVMGLSQG